MIASVQVDGVSFTELIRDLHKVGVSVEKATLAAITSATVKTQEYAKTGIARGPKSGRRYGNHRASAPGQYPATDTGRLLSSIYMELPSLGNLEGIVGSRVVYATYLEFGTSRMAARPWLLPSLKRATINTRRELEAEIEKRLK